MKKILFILLGVGAFAASSCDWWDPRGPWDPVDPGDTVYDPWEPPSDTIKDPWDPRDTSNGGGGGGVGDTIIIDPWDPGDSNWWDPRDTN